MFDEHEATVLAWVAESGLADPASIAQLKERLLATGRPVLGEAVAAGWIDRNRLLATVADRLGCGWLGDAPAHVGAEVASIVPASLARSYRVIPWRVDASGVDVLAANPFAPSLGDDLSFALAQRVRVVVTDPRRVDALIAAHYGEGADSSASLEAAESTRLADAGAGPVVRLVNAVLLEAVRSRASDVHFEPFESELRIRCRVEGVLHMLRPAPAALAIPVASRLKVMANLNIAERRVPQDGRIELRIGGRRVDLRVSTLPTQFGEAIVLRVLDRGTVSLRLEELGLPPRIEQEVGQVLERPNGMFIVTGPTGSGKTTTLYSALHRLHRPGRKLLTVEDPVEYEVDGVMQVAVNTAAGLGFAQVLRSFLRHDPDVIMVGEIRDLETAQVAIQAALTGHFVLTTLHTHDAPGAITRLADLGVEPYLIAATLEGVLAQRLVRRLCPRCRQPEGGEMDGVGASALLGQSVAYRPEGCPECAMSGYRGRTGVFEWMRMDDGLRESVVQRAPSWTLREAVRERGSLPLREMGLQAVREGITSLEEIERNC